MPKPICELESWEVQAWKEEGRKPNCCDHRHVSDLEAREKTCFGDYKPTEKPVATWVGPHHILLVADKTWRPVLSDKVAVLQLVPGTALPQSKPQPVTQFIPRGLPAIRSRKDSRTRRSLAFSVPTAS